MINHLNKQQLRFNNGTIGAFKLLSYLEWDNSIVIQHKELKELQLDDSYYTSSEKITNSTENVYLAALLDVLHYGTQKGDRTGTGTVSIFGYQMRFNQVGKHFPILTTKKVHFRSVLGELLWFINSCKGGIRGLKTDYNVSIWDEWQDLEQKGKVVAYKNMTSWNGDKSLNQLHNAIQLIKINPNSRQNVVLNWNPSEFADDMCVLPACHTMFQFNVTDGHLNLSMYQRSADLFLGVPFNIASYALLLTMIAHECELKAGDLIISFGDLHIYNNHIEQVKEQLCRKPFDSSATIEIDSSVKSVFDMKPEHIKLLNYKSHAAIKADVSV